MSLKQDELIRQLPENGFNIAKTARKIGYSEKTIAGGPLYIRTKKHRALRAYEPERLKKTIQEATALMKELKLWKEYFRGLELQSKITGLTHEQNINNTTIIGDNDIKSLATRANVNEYAKGSNAITDTTITQPIDTTIHI